MPDGGCLVYDECRALAERIESEILRMDAIFNRHDPASPVARLNGSRGRVKVEGEELWFLLELGEQFRKAWRFADEADANALEIELDQIRRLRAEGKISERDTRILREEVYLMQTSLME